MNTTKADIAKNLFKGLKITRQRSLKITETLVEIIKSELEKGEDVLISRFGKFSVKEKKERIGRNPATGEDQVLPARKVVTFKASKILKDAVNIKNKNS